MRQQVVGAALTLLTCGWIFAIPILARHNQNRLHGASHSRGIFVLMIAGFELLAVGSLVLALSLTFDLLRYPLAPWIVGSFLVTGLLLSSQALLLREQRSGRGDQGAER